MIVADRIIVKYIAAYATTNERGSSVRISINDRAMESSIFCGNARGSVEHVVREVFRDFLKSETSRWRFNDEDVSEACRVQIESYENAVEEIERAEKMVREVEAKQVERFKKIEENARATGLTKIRRQPFCTDFEGGLTEKFALLESSDLLPKIQEDLRTNELATERCKQRLPAESKDSLLEIPEVSSKPKAIKKIHENLHEGRKCDHRVVRSAESRASSHQKLRRSIMRTETQNTILVAQPNNVKFSNFEPRKSYRRAVSIKNVSNAVAKFQLETRSPSSKFSIVLGSRSGDRENLAPGMSLRMIILFSSEDGGDSEERIVVKVQFGKPVLVVVSAYRDPPILKGTKVRSSNYEPATVEESISSDIDNCASFQESSEDSWDDFPDNSAIFSSETSESDYTYLRKNVVTSCDPVALSYLDCKKCFVGEKIVVTTRLKNVGGEGRFFAMSEFDWNSMSIDDITTENSLVLRCFAISPAYFVLKRNEAVDLRIHFIPDSRGVQVDKFYIACDNLAVLPVELIGDGDVYEPGIVTFGENVEENVRFEQSEEECCEYNINLGIEVSNDTLKSSFTVSNTSGLKIHYRWEKRTTDVKEMRNMMQTWKDLPLDFLSVRPSNGVFRPCSSVTFEIEVQLTNLPAELYRAVLQLFLEDIPLAAIAREYEERVEICRERRRQCETSRDIRAKEIELWARCAESPNLEAFSSSISFEAIEDHREHRLPERRSFSA